MENCYMCIDLKRYFASAECAARGLDPFKTNLVVADPDRGKGAICLAVSPALSAQYGVKNRCRIYEIPEEADYIIAKPRMTMYMRISAHIYGIYLKYVSSEDIHVYSVDECFINAGPYLSLYKMSAKEFAQMLMDKVMKETGITATAGIGTNLFLCKVALDITAKHSLDNIGILDEDSFKQTVQLHQPITDIWGIGGGTARRLAKYGAYDLKGITEIPEKLLYKEFGVNAEFLIDHAYGREPCTIKEIHSYKSKSKSLSNSQILFEDYDYPDALLIAKEMTDNLCNEMVWNGLYTNNVSLYIGYADRTMPYTGASRKLDNYTDSYRKIAEVIDSIYTSTTKVGFPIRRVCISFNDLSYDGMMNLSFFSDPVQEEREHNMQKAVATLKNRFGKNSVLRCMSLQEKATAQIRNKLVGGHNSGES